MGTGIGGVVLLPQAAVVDNRVSLVAQGGFVQTQTCVYRDTVVDSVGGWVAIDDAIDGSGYVVAITPTSANSRILVSAVAHVGGGDASDMRHWGLRLYRRVGAGGAWGAVAASHNADVDSVGTGVFAAASWGQNQSSNYDTGIFNCAGRYVDTPADATSIHYYTLYWCSWLGRVENGRVRTLNRPNKVNKPYLAQAVSTLTASEIYYAPT